jgi:hypothetical protein
MRLLFLAAVMATGSPLIAQEIAPRASVTAETPEQEARRRWREWFGNDFLLQSLLKIDTPGSDTPALPTHAVANVATPWADPFASLINPYVVRPQFTSTYTAADARFLVAPSNSSSNVVAGWSTPAVALPNAAPTRAAVTVPSPVTPNPLMKTARGTIVSSNPSTFTGIDIGNRIGANTFYSAGFTGTSSIIANIEAGHIWNGHETLTHVTQQINGTGATGQFDRHATWVGQSIGGRGIAVVDVFKRGIAYNATLWSGAIATSWSGAAYALNFSTTFASFATPYQTAMISGVSGNTADVVTSSWGFSGDSPGRDAYTMTIDAYAAQTGKPIVFSAGNSGPTAETIGGPGTGYNMFTVAALGSDTDSPTYNTVSSFSSRGPSDAFVPAAALGSGTGAGALLNNVRAKIDIAAPGQNLTLAFYGGTTGGNSGGTNVPGANLYSGNVAGTSFAAPILAASLGLMVDYAKTNALTRGVDTRVLKVVMLNTADKTSGWSNAQIVSGNLTSTTQSLDLNVGAGRVNLSNAYSYYAGTGATRDVPGNTPGSQGTVNQYGWDYGTVNRLSQNDYLINGNFSAGSPVTVTLNWLARRSITGTNSATISDNGYANLNLEVWQRTGASFTTIVGRSNSVYNNVEHLFFNLPLDGEYGIRVVYTGDNWRFDANTSETYGLAWSIVPEPWGLMAVCCIFAFRRRRSRL